MPAAVSAALAAASSRPWGLGLLALVAYVPVFLALVAAEKPLHGAVLAGVASLGLGSVAYEAAQALFPGGHLVVTLVSAVPHLGAGALAVRLRLALAKRFAGSAALTLLALPSLWATAEWLPSRPELFGVYALPLGFIGYSQVDLPTAQLARLGSVAAVSHAVLAVNACLAFVVLRSRPLERLAAEARAAFLPRPFRVGAAAFLLLSLAGAGRVDGHASPSDAAGTAPSAGAGSGGAAAGALEADVLGAAASAPPAHNGPGLLVEVLQPNLRDSAYFAAARGPGARAWLVGRLAARSRGQADLTVLPEAAWPGPLDAAEAEDVRGELAAAFGEDGTVLFGAPAVGFVGGRTRTNSAFLFSGGELRHLYAKQRLVPIGESRFVAGPGPAVVEVSGVPITPFVCYDALFPSDGRAAVLAGARALVVITDDAFAAGSDVPELHLRAARFRAIETGVPVVLAANTGPSAVVDAAGRVTSRLPALRAGALRAVVAQGLGATPYVVHGEWLGVANAVVAGGLAALSKGGDARRKGPAQALSRKETAL